MAEEAAGDIAIKIQNVVSTINLGVRLDLVKITNTARNAEYNPARFQVLHPAQRNLLPLSCLGGDHADSRAKVHFSHVCLR